MGQAESVSVVIPAWNNAEYLREAIESALAQTHPPLEIIVVDDGSTDHTREVCESFGVAVKYIYQENDGTKGGGARHRAIKESCGDWIAPLDQDDRWRPEKLARQLAVSNLYPDAAAIYTASCSIDETGQRLETGQTFSGQTRHIEERDFFHQMLQSNPFCPSSAIVRRSATGAYLQTDPRIVGCGDWELWFSVARQHSAAVLDEALTEYRISDLQFCTNKGVLVRSMLHTLKQQRARFHERCKECEGAIQAGLAHISNVFAVAARDYLNQYHTLALSGQPLRALPFVWSALRAAPREVLRPRRSLAILKNFALAPFRRGESKPTNSKRENTGAV